MSRPSTRWFEEQKSEIRAQKVRTKMLRKRLKSLKNKVAKICKVLAGRGRGAAVCDEGKI